MRLNQLFLVSFVFAVTICPIRAQTESGDTRKILVEIRSEKGSYPHKFELGINPHEKPKKDHLSEEFYLISIASVDCIECPLLGDMSIFAAAYRKNVDKSTIIFQINFPNNRSCNIDGKRIFTGESTVVLKQKCGVELTLKLKGSQNRQNA